MPKKIPTFSQESLDALMAKAVEQDGCWVWRGATNPRGYGNVGREGVHWNTHKLAYTLMVGEVPAGLELDHVCRNRTCLNPYHLEVVTRQVNCQRADNESRARDAKGKFAGVA